MGNTDRSRGLTSFFFSNFADHLGTEELWKVFMKWGRVMNFYIPPRRDKNGLRLGFVKFKDVHNPKVLETSMEAIMIEGQRLRVNLPRYERNNKRISRRRPQSKVDMKRGNYNLR